MPDDFENLLSRAVTSNRSRMGEDIHLWAERLASEAVASEGRGSSVSKVIDAGNYTTTHEAAPPDCRCEVCVGTRTANAEPWATRIPAAIKRAEAFRWDNGWYLAKLDVPFTATEVALAKALFYSNHEDNPDAALRAFTEKVESLD